ncbi:hypothetical protein CKM354_000639100 [Cercospora kikuchii]|uniref:Zn(2)-C6 fungal-type domain-containing protein n=1 Tax=Cercospora kikuchii TaxID=84275 RepID=A0A9P3CRK7_9PEZI|nr:uncharacterized protein CKM354_000639100 [Cercospora kikuchii]GIZ43153.1 hypothetical protein CKM354_000639100 [Cercospora kikuchii]
MGPGEHRWATYTIDHPRKRRAESVCTICHSKKTKCDLAERRTAGAEKCTYCHNTGKSCQPHLGRRAIRRQRAAEHRSEVPTPALSSIREEAITVQAQQPLEQHQQTSLQPLSRTDTLDSPTTRRTDASDTVAVSHEGDLDTGFLQPFVRTEQHGPAAGAPDRAGMTLSPNTQVAPHLLHVFLEPYYDSCYAFCPVLDSHAALDELQASPLLCNALATLGSNLQPPLVPCDGPARYYDRARRMFYEDEEPNILTCLRAILLFYWWAPRSTSLVHRHSSWWWTSVVIRHAQQMNLHRLKSANDNDGTINGLQKRVWWTAFARERLTALCQSKPPIISLEDCTISAPSMEDFSTSMRGSTKALVFIHWVQLCGTIGRIAHHLARRKSQTQDPRYVSNDLVDHSLEQELLDWVTSLPNSLALGVNEMFEAKYDRDIYQLYLPYLTAVIVLDLHTAESSSDTPRAGPAAVAAASCMARIFRDILARGNTRFLMAITSWYCATAFLALLSARKQSHLTAAANTDIETIRVMCGQLQEIWGSSAVIYQGIQRMMASTEAQNAVDLGVNVQSQISAPQLSSTATGSNTDSQNDTSSWKQYFPFATAKTSEVLRIMLESDEQNATESLEASLFSNDLVGDMFDMFFVGFEDTQWDQM